VAILANLSISVKEAGALLGLFLAQFVLGAFVPEDQHGTELVIVSVVYLAMAAYILLRKRRDVGRLMKDGFKTPYEELAQSG
jgi:cation:H+ antiporter